ncbi:MAG: hypothetical protein ACREEK_10365, partial [Bradyrhizobium sp.]
MVLIELRPPIATDVGAPLFVNDAVLVGAGPGLQLLSVLQSLLVVPVQVPSIASAGAALKQMYTTNTG